MSGDGGPNGGGSGHFTWANLIALLALLVLTFGGGWTLIQSQYNSLEKAIDVAKQTGADAQALLRANNEKDIAAVLHRTDEHGAEIQKIQELLEARRDQFPTQYEFKQFEQRFDDLKKRMELVEATRPTADTLQQATNSVSRRLDELAARLAAIELSLHK